MTSVTLLRTPPASTSYGSDYISLRRQKAAKDKSLGRENSPSPTASLLANRVKSPSNHASYDSPTQPSPSPLRKRALFDRGSRGQHDSDDDDDASPSLLRLHSPFVSRCASPFIRSWGNRGRGPSSNEPFEDDEGLFLTSKTTMTPTRISKSPFTRTFTLTLNSSEPSTVPKMMVTPSAPHEQTPPILSPLRPPKISAPQTPAETDWHLGRQTESMTKLSLYEDDDECTSNHKANTRAVRIDDDDDLSPSLAPRRRGRKRSFDGKEVPRSKGGIFETTVHTPVTTSFSIPESPSPLARHNVSPSAFFGPSIPPSPAPPTKPLQLDVCANVATNNRSRSSSPKATSITIAKKYRPRDSGVAGLEEDGEIEDALGPLASTCTVVPEGDNSGFVTPGVEPLPRSGWPQIVFAESSKEKVDEFIFKTLAARGVAPKEKKVMPSTPVKRHAYAASRPWMSSSKVLPPPVVPHASGVPRKSLPLSFPNLAKIQNSPDQSDTSPSDRTFTQRKSYNELGKGRPSRLGDSGAAADAKGQFLMRRSSSGAFSSCSSSDGSLLGTPTKPTIPESRSHGFTNKKSLPSFPLGERLVRRPAFGHHLTCDPSPRPPPVTLRRPLTEHERPGKFDTDFVMVDNVGTGEFGNVLKARYKHGNGKDVFAIKKSKRFEGVKHRRRLREEIDILRHLALVGHPHGHPNVLKYIDSWEQDDVLYIQTELCELGNFGTFLTEYGSHFEALDEARIWKICTELSSGLRFIHTAGVIHLDLKPDNIFVTNEGRFRIGDFGMASFWPRPSEGEGFEREGDRVYMAPEILRGRYGKEADIFSFGMIMLETTANIVVPDMGDDWHRLREDDFSAVDFSAIGTGSPCRPRSDELVELIRHMMCSDPDARLTIEDVHTHTIVQRARAAMERKLATALQNNTPLFAASPLGGESDEFMEEVLLLASDPTHVMELRN